MRVDNCGNNEALAREGIDTFYVWLSMRVDNCGNNEALAREGIDTIKDFECIEDKHLVTMRH